MLVLQEMSYQDMKKHGGNLMHIIKGKKPIWKSYLLYIIPSVVYYILKQGKAVETEKRNSCQ
jgi:hypothetical protein